MILQALNDYYRRSVDLPREGWVRRGVDYLLVLDKDGSCIGMECIQEQVKGKSIAHQMLVPSIGKQAMKHNNSGKDANLLWDNGSFVLGGEGKGAVKVRAFVTALEEWLGGVKDDGLAAIQTFAKSVQSRPETRSEILTKFNLKDLFDERDYVIAFKLHGDVEPLHNRPAIRDAFERKLKGPITKNQVLGNCLVTGETQVPIALNETVIKGISGGQQAGVNLISFNKRSFESYGKRERRGENAPVSLTASFAYTTALNSLLTSEKQRVQVADATTVFWASEQHEMEDLFGEVLRDDPGRGADALKALYQAALTGRFTVGDSNDRFFVLGLAAPANSRIAIRFYQTATAKTLAERMVQHFSDLQVTDTPQHYSISRLLKAIAVRGERENIPQTLASDFLRAAIEGTPYPMALLSQAVQRCRAEQAKRDKRTGSQNVPRERAAILKACLNRSIRRNNQNTTEPETPFTPMLDPTNTNNAYRLGRLFAALEKTQEDAHPGLNATIRDRYYGAASSTPATVFSTLLRLKNHHIGKLHPGQAIKREKLIGEIMNGIDNFPGHLPLPGQARFALGYYHQRQDFFTKKDQSTEPNNN